MPTIHFLREQLHIDCQAGVILRDLALDTGVQLYGFKGRLGNCGGCGQCSTCFVAVASPKETSCLSSRTAPEQRFLKTRPSNWRLACQAVVQDSMVVVTRPQSGWSGGDEALAAAATAMGSPTQGNAPPHQNHGNHKSNQEDGSGADGDALASGDTGEEKLST